MTMSGAIAQSTVSLRSWNVNRNASPLHTARPLLEISSGMPWFIPRSAERSRRWHRDPNGIRLPSAAAPPHQRSSGSRSSVSE